MVKNRSKLSKKIPKKGKPSKGVTIQKAAIAVTTSRRAVNKKITQSGDLVTVHHRELLVPTYAASSSFSLDNKIALNPAISTYSSGSPMGTWLPSIAKNYDKYRLRDLKFHFITYAATTTPGMIAMSYDPNPENANPTSMQDVQNMHFTCGSVHNNLTFDVTPRLPKEFKYTRTGTVSALLNYDSGFVNFSSIGGPGSAVGMIEVEYLIEFKNPQSSNSTQPPLPSIPVLPVQVVEATAFSGTTMDLYNPASVNSSGGHYPQIMWNYQNTKAGANLITFTDVSNDFQTTSGFWDYPNGVTKDPSVTSNCTFIGANSAAQYPTYGQKRPYFTFNKAGRYRVTIEAPFDININATAAYQLFGFRKLISSGTPPSWSLPLTETTDIDGYVTAFKFPRVHVQQGVQNDATKTAADTTQRFEFEISTEPDWRYCLFGGCEVQTLVASSCALTGRSSITPPPRLIVTYLGPRLTTTDIYDI